LPDAAVIEIPADGRISQRVEELLAAKHVTVVRSDPKGNATPEGFAPVASASPRTQPTHRRPGIVTLLAVLQFIGAAFCIGGAIVMCLGAAFFSEPMEPGILIVIGVVFGVLGSVQLICGLGLWKLKNYGRTIQQVFSWIGLLGFPIGTIIAILILLYLRKPGVRILFSGKPITQLTPDEAVQVAALATEGSAFVVVAVVLSVFVAIAGVGIIAAIAVPGLLRARMAGNEASAIGSLRAINSANINYMINCAKGSGYANTLDVLGTPPTAGGGPFVSADLSGASPVIKSGYRITYSGGGTAVITATCVTATTTASTTYFAAAAPIAAGTSGTRYFATSEAQTIFQDVQPITGIDVTGRPTPSTAVPLR
jgi:type II secretory pathway pseudopilin PulG